MNPLGTFWQPKHRFQVYFLLAIPACSILFMQVGCRGQIAGAERLGIVTRDDRTQTVLIGDKPVLEIYRAKDGWLKTWSFGDIQIVERCSQDVSKGEEILFCSRERILGKLVRGDNWYVFQDVKPESVDVSRQIASGVSLIEDVAKGSLRSLTNLAQIRGSISNAATPMVAASNILRRALEGGIKESGGIPQSMDRPIDK